MTGPYDVSIRLFCENLVSRELALIMTQVGRLSEMWKGMSASMKTLTVGALGVGLGAAMVKPIEEALKAGNELIQAQNKMAYAGGTVAEVADATRLAWEGTAKYMNVSAVAGVHMANDLRQVFGSQEAANRYLPEAIRFMAMTKSWSEGKGLQGKVDPEKETFAAIKSAEMAGKSMSPEKLHTYLDSLQRALQAGGGNVSSQQFLAAQRIAGTAFYGWDDKFRFGVFPAMIQELGVKAGTQAMTSYSKLGAGNAWSKTNLAEGIDAGIIDPKKVEYDKTGRPMRLMPGGLKFGSEYAAQPLQFYEDRLKPWLDKKYGKDLDDPKVLSDRVAALTRLGGTQNIGRFLSELMVQQNKFEKDAGLPGRVKGDPELYMKSDWLTAITSFHTQWQNLMTALGSSNVGPAANVLNQINSVLATMAQSLKDNPALAGNLMKVAMGLSALLIVGGAVAVFAGAISALGGLPFITVAAGLGYMAHAILSYGHTIDDQGKKRVGWDAALYAEMRGLDKAIEFGKKSMAGISDWAAKIAAWLTPVAVQIGSALTSIGAKFAEGIRALPGTVYNAITAAMNAIATAFKNAISAITGIGGGGGAPYTGRFTPGATFNPGGAQQLGPSPAPAIPPPAAPGPVTINNSVNVDGRKLAQNTMSYAVGSANYPRDIGGSDGRNQWHSPGAESPALG